MATREAMQIREERAVERLSVAVTELARGAGIAPPSFDVIPGRQYQRTKELERLEVIADFLESLQPVPAEEKKPKPKPRAKPKKG
jgi:hypothetical protein